MMKSTSDKELLKQIACGDEKAFESLFRTWYGLMVTYAYRFLRDRQQAESVVQMVFISVWERRADLQVNDFKSYLAVSVRNRCMNHLNREKSHASLDEHAVCEKSVTEEELPNGALLEKIYRAIDRMPPQRQRIFKMGRFDGLKYREIAALLNISQKTVEAQMSKALKYLRTLFVDAANKEMKST